MNKPIHVKQAGIELPSYKPIVEQPKGFDLFSILGLRRFIRWKYARFIFQLPLLILALMVIIDGFTGRQLAPRNVATTSVWLHYRGLVVLALALVGNAFCAACPLMLTRGASRRLERFLPSKLAWPSFLKNKYLVLIITFFYLFSYEYFDLWASPWLTAWLAIGYFGTALVIDTLFSAGTFCRFVCPLGNFNFIFSSASPTQIRAKDHDVCRSCEHKPCLQGRYSAKSKPSHLPLQTNGANQVAFIPITEIINQNGSGFFPGCETDLFVPTMQSNMDCTNCFNCVRACPYDNVALVTRSPAWEWIRNPWQKRGRLAVSLFGISLTFWGLLNAVAMISPFFILAETVARALNTSNEFLLLSSLFIIVTVVGLGVTTLFTSFADFIGGKGFKPKQALERWAYVVVALGFGFWGAHYIFHFLTGALSIIPVFQHFFELRGFAVDPNWRLSQFVPSAWLFPINAAITSVYSLIAMYVVVRISLRDFGRKGVLVMWPMLMFVLLFAVVGILILAQPMEMRGTILGISF